MRQVLTRVGLSESGFRWYRGGETLTSLKDLRLETAFRVIFGCACTADCCIAFASRSGCIVSRTGGPGDLDRAADGDNMLRPEDPGIMSNVVDTCL